MERVTHNFAEESKNLAKYKSENNFVGHQNYYVERVI